MHRLVDFEGELHGCRRLERVISCLTCLDRAAAGSDRPDGRSRKSADVRSEAREDDRQPRGRARLERVATLPDHCVGGGRFDERDRLGRADDLERPLDPPVLVSGVSGWRASSRQTPVARSFNEEPVSLQTLEPGLTESVTGRPEVALAETVSVPPT